MDTMTQFPWEPILALLFAIYGIGRKPKNCIGRREFERYRDQQEGRYTLATERWARLAVRVGNLEQEANHVRRTDPEAGLETIP